VNYTEILDALRQFTFACGPTKEELDKIIRQSLNLWPKAGLVG
jgi:hypothetical protein